MTSIETNSAFLAQLERHEGFRNFVYRCTSGCRTIGFGHNLDANPIPGIDEKSVISWAEGELILVADVQRFAKDLDKKLPWWRTLNEPRQAVLLNMAFNMGMASLLKFNNTLRMMRTGRYAEAAEGMWASRWAGQVKMRARELCAQMASGEWQ